MTDPASFFDLIYAALDDGTFLKATLSRPEKAAPLGLRQVFLRPVELRGTAMIAWNHRYERRDEVKNLTHYETLARLREVCGAQFRNADVFTAAHEASLTHNRRGEPAVFIRDVKHAAPTEDETEHARPQWRPLLSKR